MGQGYSWDVGFSYAAGTGRCALRPGWWYTPGTRRAHVLSKVSQGGPQGHDPPWILMVLVLAC